MTPLTDAEVLAAIRANHLKANIGGYESRDDVTIHWDQAWLDPGHTIFGAGPYAKARVSTNGYDSGWDVVVRVYPPERLRKRLAKQWRPE